MDKFNPKVSIVIPVYNGAKYLGEAIDSALAQTYKNIEIIVSNDGSNDDGATDRVAKSYGDKIIYLNKVENGGAATSLNAAIKVMTGEYFSWLSHDDKYYPNKIKRQIEELAKLEDKNTIMMSDLDGINEKYEKIYETQYINRIKEYPARERSYLYPVLYNQTHGCTLLIPKACFDRVGLFDVGEIVAQDFEFFSRAFAEFPHKLVSEVLVTARDTSNRMGRRAKPRASVEYSRLYISMLDKMSDEDMELLAPDKLTLFYDMYIFFKYAGYIPGLDYIKERILKYLPVYSSDLLRRLLNNKIDLNTAGQLFSKLRIYLSIWNNNKADITNSLDLMFSGSLKGLSKKDINNYLSNNYLINNSVYDLFLSNGCKRTAAYFIKGTVDCLIKMEKTDSAVNAIYEKIVGNNIAIQENNIISLINKMQKKSNKKRLLFCSTHWLTGGMERVMSNLFEQLKANYEIYLITPFDGRKGLIELPDYVTHIKISNSLFYTNFDGAILSHSIMLDVDVVIGFYNLFEGQLDLYSLCEGTKIKTIASNHEYYFYPYKTASVSDIVFKRLSVFKGVDAVLWPTNFSAAAYGLCSDNVYVMPNPNTFEVQDNDILQQDQKIIICVGRFNDYIKRIDRILNCFSLVLDKEPSAKLMLVGKCNRNSAIKPSESTTINDLLVRFNIEESSVIFVGEVSSVEDYYKRASLLLLTSSNEGFGMVLNEAACFGVPSVCNNIPGIEDLVIDGENGYIVEQDDIESMADRVCQILSDNDLRKRLGENAKKIVRKFGSKAIGDKWRYLIDTLVKDRSREVTITDLNKQLLYTVSDYRLFSKIIFNELNSIQSNNIEAKVSSDINAIHNSTSWKITKPVRIVGKGISSIKNNGLRFTIKVIAKKIYKKLINK